TGDRSGRPHPEEERPVMELVPGCPECGSVVYLDPVRAETVCAGCSIVVQDRLVESERPVQFDENGGTVQSGGPALPSRRSSADLMTVVRGYRDARGNALNHSQLVSTFRLERNQRQLKSRGTGRSLFEMDKAIA